MFPTRQDKARVEFFSYEGQFVPWAQTQFKYIQTNVLIIRLFLFKVPLNIRILVLMKSFVTTFIFI